MSAENYNYTRNEEGFVPVELITPSGEIYTEGKIQVFVNVPQGGNGEPIPYWWHLLQGHGKFEIGKERDDSRKDETVVPDKPTITRREFSILVNKPLPEEFKCEICGNFRYRDRNGFERHFKLARHTYGMSNIGIPNSLMFKGVTSIEAARDRWDKIQAYRRLTNWKPTPLAAYVDEYGHPTDDNTYADMRRQGLI